MRLAASTVDGRSRARRGLKDCEPSSAFQDSLTDIRIFSVWVAAE
jgi:hypothetical protein